MTMTDEFIEDCVAAAGSLASFYVGVSENEMLQSLYDVRADFEAGLAEKFGPDVAAMIVGAFAVGVLRRRQELEAGGGASSPRVLN
jgi:hypothetical protein